MIKSYPDESGASDIDFIYGGAKAVDPESVVRGSEGVMFQKTGGILGELAALLGQVKSGRKLRQEERKSILDLVGRRRDELVNTYTGAVNEYKGLTDRAGGNFSNVGIYGDYQPSNSLLEALNKPPQASGSPSPSPSIPAGMKLQRNPKTGATRLVPMN
jgi:gas vesicle protein